MTPTVKAEARATLAQTNHSIPPLIAAGEAVDSSYLEGLREGARKDDLLAQARDGHDLAVRLERELNKSMVATIVLRTTWRRPWAKAQWEVLSKLEPQLD